jgi:exosortase
MTVHTSTAAQALPTSTQPAFGSNPRYILLLLLGCLLVFCYFGTFAETAVQIQGSDDMAQAYMAPLIAAIVAWDKRNLLFGSHDRPALAGLAAVLGGAAMAVVAAAGASGTLARAGFLCSLAGCILCTGGWATLRQLRFSFVMLLFVFPLPPLLYDEVTMPLRMMASQMAELMLEAAGHTVIRQGNVLELRHITLSVVDACSGLRSLLALTFMALAYGYFLEKRQAIRGALVLTAIPVAILVNALRVTATGVLSVYSREWVHGTWHDMLGWGGLALGFLVLAVLHKLYERWIPARAGARG